MNSFSETSGAVATPDVMGRKSFFGVVALALLATFGCSSSPQAYLERGNRFAAAGKYDDAIIQYRKALQKSPQLGEAHYRLGLAALKKSLPVDAYQELRRAGELMPANDEVQAKLGELSTSLYNADPRHPKQYYDQAAKIADQLLAKNPEGFDGNRLKGALALIDQKPAQAIEYLRKADKAKPNDQEVQMGLAIALVRDNQVPAGLDLARSLIAKDKTFGRAYDFLFEQYEAAKRTQEAEDILLLKVANNPKQADYILELARYYAVASKPAEMSATLQKLLDNPADFPDSRMRVGNFYESLGKPDEALRMFQEGVKVDPKHAVEYQKRMVQVLAGQRKFAEAIQQLNEVLKAHPDDRESKLARALIWLDEGKPENLDPAIAELRAQIPLKPQDLTMHYQLGLALARKGDPEGARHEFSAAAQKNRNYLPPRFALASLDLSQGRPQEALPVSEEILAVAPANPEAQLLNAVCLTNLSRFGEARARLNHLIQQSPQWLGARYELGVLAISEKKYKEAEDIFQQLQQYAKDDPRVISGLAEAYKGENQSGRALQLLQDEVKRSPNSPMLHGLLAQFAGMSGNYDIAIAQYKQMAAANPKSIDIPIRLGEAYEAKGDLPNAIASFEKAEQTDPKSVPAAVVLAQAYYSEGKTGEAMSGYRRVLALQKDEPRALNNLAFLMLEAGESPDEALKMAQRGLQVVREPGLKASLSDTVGWAYFKKRMYDEAVQTFQSLVQANTGNATFRYHLGAALYEKGDRQRARTELQAALAAKPNPADEPKIRELIGKL
jgi:tetratricopeptide (TPR) repeat protein